jgi:hypothetical protein
MHTRYLSTILVLAGLVWASAAVPWVPSCQIAFRLDVVKEGFEEAAQKAVIRTFLNRRVPLTVSVDARTLGKGGGDYLQSVAGDPFLEIALHGWLHEDEDTKLNKDTEIRSLQNSKHLLERHFAGIKQVVSFVTSTATHSDMAKQVLASVGFEVLSASAHVCPPDSETGLRLRPTSAATSWTDSKTGMRTGCPATHTLHQIQEQVNRCGFSVVQLRPQEFWLEGTSSHLNRTMIGELDELLHRARSLGCSLDLLRDLTLSPSAQEMPAVEREAAAASAIEANEEDSLRFLLSFTWYAALVGGLLWFYKREWDFTGLEQQPMKKKKAQ